MNLWENMRRGNITAAEKKRAIAKLLEMDGGDTPANRRKVSPALNMTVGELKEALEVGEWAETFEPHNITLRMRRRGEGLGKTVVPTSAARVIVKTLRDEKVREPMAQLRRRTAGTSKQTSSVKLSL